MEDHAAAEDDLVRFQRGLVDHDGRTARGRAHLDEVGILAALMVHDADATGHIGGDEAGMLFRRMAAMRARGHQQGHVRVGDAAGAERGHHFRHIDLRRLPEAGNIGDDDADLVPGLHDGLQSRGIHGLAQGAAHHLRRRQRRQVHGIGQHFGGKAAIGHIKEAFAIAVFQGMSGHEETPSLR